ncbi:hypothetical protein NE857_27975 [Nocardiopsis exhalans]|uniref:Uncharacterized protein n=1 Tax=Nocardiopsis exhalans TaxID=163604 RepID=A0ABY5D812_9ACTN|nr:hypothetical protein [Nocardiopsis exhalans]USY19070.1 hypothetical protein NE857_27975 [Nocardiopsis exhalans]
MTDVTDMTDADISDVDMSDTGPIVDDLEMSGHYGDGMADVYDLVYPETPDALECASFVASLCPEGARYWRWAWVRAGSPCPSPRTG